MDRLALRNSIDDYQQRVFIKFGVLLGWSAANVHKQLSTALTSNAYSVRTVRRWVEDIKNGKIDIGERRGGDRSDSSLEATRLEKIQELLRERRDWSVRTIEATTDIPRETVRNILRNKLGLNKVHKTWVPYELNEDQKINRVTASQANLLRFRKTKKLLERTIAIDESWIPMYEPVGNGSKVWLHPTEPRQTQVKGGFQQKKRMLIMAMDYSGIAFWKLLPEKTTVTAEVYRDFIKENIEDWKLKNNVSRPVIAHDNARPHVAKLVQDFFTENQISLWVQPAYSPDLQPCDYSCFGPLKKGLKCTRYQGWAEVETTLKNSIADGLSKGWFQGVKDLPKRWERVIELQGDYYVSE